MSKSLFIDEETRQRVLRQPHSGDIVFDADIITGGSAIAMETVPVVGPWIDYTGSDPSVNSKNQQMFGGVENEFQGTDQWIEHGEQKDNLDIVGNRASTTRRRLRKIYKEF